MSLLGPRLSCRQLLRPARLPCHLRQCGQRRVIIETDQPRGCPTCGIVASRWRVRRLQRIRDIPVAGSVDVLWSKFRWYREEPACPRLGVVDGRDHNGVGDWPFARPLAWRLGVQVVAIDPSAAFRKALRMWLPRTAVAVDHFHLVSLGNRAMAEAERGPPPRGSLRRRRPDRQARSSLEGQGTAADTAAHELPRRRGRRERGPQSPPLLRLPPGRKRTSSTGPSAGGGKRSKPLSPTQPPARSKPTTPASNTTNAQRAATATPAITNQLFS
ncbi:hypothetical protein ABIA70_000441 [Arthrobacter sp. 754]